MDPLLEDGKRPNYLSWLALLVAIMALGLVLVRQPSGTLAPAGDTPMRLERILTAGVVRVGYGGFPPYTVIDLNETDPQKRVTGFSVDLVNEIASRHAPPIRVEWERFSFDSMKADLATDRFDFIADPVFQTVPRAAEFALTIPYAYFGIAVGVVRSGDTRFKVFGDLDRPGIVVALAEGWTSSEYARAHLTQPQFKSIPVTGDAFNQLDEVLLGRADVALNDVPTVAQYVATHESEVDALWLHNPPSMVAGGFMLRREDVQLRAFLDTALRVVQADGVLNALDRKWNAYALVPEFSLRSGSDVETVNR